MPIVSRTPEPLSSGVFRSASPSKYSRPTERVAESPAMTPMVIVQSPPRTTGW